MKWLAAWMRPVGQGVLVAASLVGWVMIYAVTLLGVFSFWLAFNAASGVRKAGAWIWKATRRKEA